MTVLEKKVTELGGDINKLYLEALEKFISNVGIKEEDIEDVKSEILKNQHLFTYNRKGEAFLLKPTKVIDWVKHGYTKRKIVGIMRQLNMKNYRVDEITPQCIKISEM